MGTHPPEGSGCAVEMGPGVPGVSLTVRGQPGLALPLGVLIYILLPQQPESPNASD